MIASRERYHYRLWEASYALHPRASELSASEMVSMWKHAVDGMSSTRRGTPLSDEFMRLMRGMLHPDPAARLSLADVRNSAFLKTA